MAPPTNTVPAADRHRVANGRRRRPPAPGPDGPPPRRPRRPNSFDNRLLRQHFPDPFVLQVNGTITLNATNGSGKNIQTAQSPDLVDRQMVGHATPALPLGEAVLNVGPRRSSPSATATGCITRRTIKRSTGNAWAWRCQMPTASSRRSTRKPLVCQADEGGTIDPILSGRRALPAFERWHSSAICRPISTPRNLAADGRAAAKASRLSDHNDEPWRASAVKRDTMIQHQGITSLLRIITRASSMPWAMTRQSATGPWSGLESPIWRAHGTVRLVVGPGHQALIRGGANLDRPSRLGSSSGHARKNRYS